MKIKVFQLHKRSSYVFSEIQDKFAINTDLRAVALSDGATQGFKSEIWAELLVDSFVEKPIFESTVLESLMIEKAKIFDELEHPFSENFAIKALEKKKQEAGGFATFLGLQFSKGSVKYISSGDVCSFVLKGGQIVSSFPFKTLQELDNDKGFIGTKNLLNPSKNPLNFYTKEMQVNEGENLVISTDAIARYILETRDLKVLNSNNFEDFKNFIIELWENKKLEEDDISIIEISNVNQPEIKIEELLPPDDFYFPKEDIPISVSPSEPLISKDMNELQNRIHQLSQSILASQKEITTLKQGFNRYNEELKNLRKKIKKLTLFSAVLFLLLIGSLLYLFTKKWVDEQPSNLKENVSATDSPDASPAKIIKQSYSKDSLKVDRKNERQKGNQTVKTVKKPSTEKEKDNSKSKQDSLKK